MFKKLTLFGAALAMTATAVIPAAPAMAQSRAYRDAYRDGYNRETPRTYRGNDRNYRDYRARERCRSGDGGTIIGAIAGGLLGNTIAGRGNRTLGTVLGAGGGALAGRAIDRSGRPGYCR
jgi:uncharacterized protein YcfJ